jgi:hypothetical protein
MLLLLQVIIYVLAVAGNIGGACGALFFAGGAMNQARPRDFRVRRAVYAGLCACGVFASAALGFVGIAAIMYFAQPA